MYFISDDKPVVIYAGRYGIAIEILPIPFCFEIIPQVYAENSFPVNIAIYEPVI